MGPTIVFDKSALQALSLDESVWLEAFFSTNVVPIFYVETLADLEKGARPERSAEDLVGQLADKTPANSFPNVHHRELVLGSLLGRSFEMDGRAVISGGDYRRTADGKVGLHVEEFPEAAALHRWRAHEFLDIERDVARSWRAELAGHNPEAVVTTLRNVLPRDRKLSTIEELKSFVDAYCASASKRTLELAFAFFEAPAATRHSVLRRWTAARKPPLPRFAPYAAHALKVELLFYLGIARGFISGERASNRADMAYLHYLPFCHAFASGDRLHARTAPLFMEEHQSYLTTNELKESLAEFNRHFAELPQEVKDLGVMQFASYPPADIDNAVTRLWDKTAGEGWREQSRAREETVGTPRDPDADKATVAEMNRIADGARRLAGDFEPEDGPEYTILQRFVPASKGSWRIVSREIEEADDRPE